MEIGKQLKKFRGALNFSQEQLAEKVFVSRQTISNWENDKNYPDVKSLLLLSSIFEVSLDVLVKGDLNEMREQVEKIDSRGFKRDSNIFGVLLLATIMTPVPLVHSLSTLGFGVWGIIALVTVFYAFKVERFKKNHDIQTYREIIAFSEGKGLETSEKQQEIGKRNYQKVLLALGTATIAFVVGMAFMFFLK